jgi:hypothetical protein
MAYPPVETAEGLGIEAQRVEAFARQEGASISSEYVEVETGKGQLRDGGLR